MDRKDAETIQQIGDDVGKPGFLRSGNQNVRALLGELAVRHGYTGDANFADDAGVDTLARLGGQSVGRVLDNLAKKVGGTVMESDVANAKRKYGIK
jgi:hypothetical protein